MTKPVRLRDFLALVQESKRFWHEDVILPSVQAKPSAASAFQRTNRATSSRPLNNSTAVRHAGRAAPVWDSPSAGDSPS
jgi:hypothetical protein